MDEQDRLLKSVIGYITPRQVVVFKSSHMSYS